jgi:Type I site-specific restriction-modification system, R (restriction) subunit and related helicases
MQSTNFEFLRPQWPDLADLGGFIEYHLHVDPGSSLVKSRILGEQIAFMVCNVLCIDVRENDSFLSMLKAIESTKALPDALIDTFHILRYAGNKGAHRKKVKDDAARIASNAYDLARWWVLYITKSEKNIPAESFIVPAPGALVLSQLEIAVQERVAKETEALKYENASLRQKLAALTEVESSVIQQDFMKAASALKFNEVEIRKYLIDEMLIKAGWDVSNPDEVGMEVEVDGQPTPSRQGRTDYLLYDDDGTVLAVIEAKRAGRDARLGRKQAQLYADALEKEQNGLRPFIILSNGLETVLVDDKGGPVDLPVKGYPDRIIYGMPAKETLQYRLRHQRSVMKDPGKLPHRSDIAGRPYQREAIKAVAERFGEKRRRKALIVQATGTGKTRVAIAIAGLLNKAGFARRILFLCDRRELRRQAKNAFTEFMPDWNVSILGREKDSAAQVILATYPAMMKQYQKYDIGWFDLIIADESHRSIYNKYRDLFLYFDALQLGLTATPRAKVSHNTYRMFDCEPGDPTYWYEYDKAVEEKWLSDFTPVSVTTKFQREGVRYDLLSPEEQQRLEEDGEDAASINYESSDLDKQVYVTSTNILILKNLMENGLRDVTENGPGKSIIFARNHKHAEFLGKLFQKNFPEYGPEYCAVIDNYNPRAEQLIDDFKAAPGTPNKPVIAISVDMLDTGIDVPEILNLVFAKPVKSYVKFWQMIGRGTRLCPGLLPGGKDKAIFYIFDHWGNCEFFSVDKRWEEPAPSQSLMERLFEARIGLAETSLVANDKESFDRAIPLIRGMLRDLDQKSLPVMEKLRSLLAVLHNGNLEQFTPQLVDLMRRELLPLMRYVSIRNDRPAYEFDLLIANLQTSILAGQGSMQDRRDRLENLLASLQLHINAVKEKFADIKELREESFWSQPMAELLAALEDKRLALRGIMKYHDAASTPPGMPPRVLDVADGEVQTRVLPTFKPSSQHMQAYKEALRTTLEVHFETNPVLKKIRHGEAIQPEDIDSLAALALTQNSMVSLDTLREFYPTAPELERELRAIIGMDANVVEKRFALFFDANPGLSGKQMAFMNLLQKHIKEYGPVRLDKLYEAPFTHVSSEGPEGIFTDKKQLGDLFGLLRSFGAE